ncbi:hypothetical protein EJ110_NYTH52043 [Nymphaea thermarum]|nr:hypothetical protein EJ110_NYTH52043 [Nymphaea thermarum]
MAGSLSSSTQGNAISALVSVKMKRDNYLLWSSQLESVMESQELVQFINGSSPPPPEVIIKDGKSEINLEFIVWKRSNRLTLSWIKATISKPILGQIVSCKSAYAAWHTLKKSFRQEVDDSDLVPITMNGLPVECESFVTLISANSSYASFTFSELFDLRKET